METVLGTTRASLSATVVNDIESVTLEMSNQEVVVANELPSSIYALYVSIAGPVRKISKTSTIARPTEKRRQNSATAIAIAVVVGIMKSPSTRW